MSRPKTDDRARGIDWAVLVFIAAYHLLLVAALPLYLISATPGWPLVGCFLFLVIGALLSITAGYHRLYAHRTYRIRKPMEWGLLFFSTMAAEGPALRWAHDHRKHHRFVDADGDPYGTQKGFWYSHLLWMFWQSAPFEDRYLADLKQNKLLLFQYRYYGWLLAATNILAILAVAWVTGDLAGAFVIAFLLRMFVVHHSTWFINSLCHMWGAKPYSSEHSAVNNFILAVLTLGEGYHNYHHTFAGDYRNGVRWYQLDPPKYMIWLMSKIGLAWDLKRTDPLMIKKKLVQADSMLLKEHLERVRHIDVSSMVSTVESMSEKLSGTINSAKALLDRYRALDKRRNRIEVEEVRQRFRALKHEISRDLKTWRRLCRLILKMEPAF